ncbi:hypothetical protein [Sphingobium sp. CFD-1]|uniref:hypothetical protein n=1 Tax=Sphingobium sp. CFD-1 TaxID=2878545 RepID=UPI00214A8FCC|nr:hypothetical protein [Sphingobium sp. CFD-1]
MADSGLISAFLYKDDAILQGVLSCRVFGLGSEYATMHYLMRDILERHPQVSGKIVDTGKNFTCHPFFTNAGFTAIDEQPETFVATRPVALPAHIINHPEGMLTV